MPQPTTTQTCVRCHAPVRLHWRGYCDECLMSPPARDPEFEAWLDELRRRQDELDALAQRAAWEAAWEEVRHG